MFDGRALRDTCQLEVGREGMPEAVEVCVMPLAVVVVHLCGLPRLSTTTPGPTLERWQRVTRSKPFEYLRPLRLVDTEASHFLQALRHPRAGTSTNLWLGRMRNFTLDMGWILMPVPPKAGWLKIKHPNLLVPGRSERSAGRLTPRGKLPPMMQGGANTP